METIAFNDFMSGDYMKEKYYASKKDNTKSNVGKVIRRVGTSITIPLLLAKPAFAASSVAVPVNVATEFNNCR